MPFGPPNRTFGLSIEPGRTGSLRGSKAVTGQPLRVRNRCASTVHGLRRAGVRTRPQWRCGTALEGLSARRRRWFDDPDPASPRAPAADQKIRDGFDAGSTPAAHQRDRPGPERRGDARCMPGLLTRPDLSGRGRDHRGGQRQHRSHRGSSGAHDAIVLYEPRSGVCSARQCGLMAATGEVVVSTDADTTFAPSWLETIESRLAQHPEAVGVAGPCVFVDGRGGVRRGPGCCSEPSR